MREASLIHLFVLYRLLLLPLIPFHLFPLLDEVRLTHTHATHFEGMQHRAVSDRPRLHIMALHTCLAARGAFPATPRQPLPRPLRPSCHARAVTCPNKASEPAAGSAQGATIVAGHSGCCSASECRRRKAHKGGSGAGQHTRNNGRTGRARLLLPGRRDVTARGGPRGRIPLNAGLERWLFPAEAAEVAGLRSFRLVLRGVRLLGSQNPSFRNAVTINQAH